MIDAHVELLNTESIGQATLIASLAYLKALEITKLIPLSYWVECVYAAASDPAITPFNEIKRRS